MAKGKKFREWIEEEALKDEEDMRFRKKDSKRYDNVERVFKRQDAKRIGKRTLSSINPLTTN